MDTLGYGSGDRKHDNGPLHSLTLMPAALRSALLTCLVAGLSGCAVVSVAGAVAGAAITVGGAVVSTGVKVTGKVIEKTIDVVTPGSAEEAVKKD